MTPFRSLLPCLLAVLALAFAFPTVAVAGDEAAARRGDVETRTEVVTVKHIEAHQAQQVLRPFSSRDVGRLDSNDELSLLTIVDRPALVARMLEVLAEIDRPRAQLKLDVYLVVAGPKVRAGTPPGPELDAVLDELRNLFAYDTYSVMDRGTILMTAGQEASLQVGGSEGWQLDVTSREQGTEGDRFGLNVHLYKSWEVEGSGGVFKRDTIVSTSLEVKDGQTSVVGASKLDGDDRALITILRTRVIE